MRTTADVTGGKPITVRLQSISGVGAINLLVAFYDIHARKGEVLFFCFCPGHHTRLFIIIIISVHFSYIYTSALHVRPVRVVCSRQFVHDEGLPIHDDHTDGSSHRAFRAHCGRDVS
jgi:hypothetical protein